MAARAQSLPASALSATHPILRDRTTQAGGTHMTVALIPPITTSKRIDALSTVLLRAGTAAASLRGSVTSEAERVHAATIAIALDTVLGELRVIAGDLR